MIKIQFNGDTFTGRIRKDEHGYFCRVFRNNEKTPLFGSFFTKVEEIDTWIRKKVQTVNCETL